MSADRTIPTTAEVRERFIDGFPMDTWVAARAECGEDFDRWLAEHDAQVLRDAAERLNKEGQNLPRWPGRTRDMPRNRVIRHEGPVLSPWLAARRRAGRRQPVRVRREGIPQGPARLRRLRREMGRRSCRQSG